ncbi:MAG TPA: aminoacyl-tRNA deacylase [Chloroflexi bacterium]|nr:aminoacyl-tRNA deacylase [Chloroflexota bacterium]HAL26607.1 aminoacyl-tRNA deacylase [Chloroflexota bacterium]
MDAGHPNVARVSAHAAARGVPIAVTRFTATTRTAQDAAQQIGCTVAEIVKSLVFLADGAPVVVLCSGADRVDESKLREHLGTKSVRRATADEAKSATGFAIGGVPPFGHVADLRVVVDRGLLELTTVWAAAGLPDAVFPIAPAELVRLSDATNADVT